MSADVLPLARYGVTVQIGDGTHRAFREGPASRELLELLRAVTAEVEDELAEQRREADALLDFGVRYEP